MKSPTFAAVLAATMMLTASASFAQTSEQEKGSTGWSGAQKDQVTQSKGSQGHPVDQTTGQAVTVHDEAEKNQQPAMATGQDLKGPPKQFAPSQTPE
jgi:hypothetical protein